MNYKFYIAKRFLFSKKESRFISFITYFSILGVTLGVAALIIAVSILNGFEKEIKEKVAGLVSHIQISSFFPEGVENPDEIISLLKDKIPDITAISPYIQKEAVIRYKDKVEGIILKGINPVSDVSTSRNKIIRGNSDLLAKDTIFSRLIIGDKLAKKLGVDIGNKVVIFGLAGIPSPFNQPKLKQFIVAGIYETGLRDYDDVLIYTDLKTAQRLFNFYNNVSGIEMKIADIDKAEEVVTKIKRYVDYPNYPRSLYKVYRGLFSWVELQKAPTPVILALIIVVAVFNIVGTLLMLILEKTQSIGILKSLGVSSANIRFIFLLDGMIIGFIGTFLGIVLGVGLSLLELKFRFFKLPDIYYMKNVPILLEVDKIVLISAITLVLVFIATLIPSHIASKFEPIKSLRFM
ncbi:MAG: ABC transporter permease [Ignavibacteria bacterium]